MSGVADHKPNTNTNTAKYEHLGYVDDTMKKMRQKPVRRGAVYQDRIHTSGEYFVFCLFCGVRDLWYGIPSVSEKWSYQAARLPCDTFTFTTTLAKL